MSKRKSPFSVDYQTPVFIASNDPRNKNDATFEKYRSRIGRDVEVVDMGEPRLLSKYIPPTPVEVDRQFFTDIVYGNGRFVTVCNEIMEAFGDDEYVFIATSIDAVNWTLSPTPGPYNYGLSSDLIFDGSNFIIPVSSLGVNNSGYPDAVHLLAQSSNGSTWTYTANDKIISNFYFGNGIYIKYEYDQYYNVYKSYSTDLTTWTIFSSTINIIGFVNGIFIGTELTYGPPASGSLYYSTNGHTWTYGSSGLANIDSTLAYGAGKFVVTGWDYPDNPGHIYYSSDGANWTNVTIEQDMRPAGIAFGNNRFIIAGSSVANNSAAMYSTDGINWNMITDPTLNDVAQYMDFWKITYGGGNFVITGYRLADFESPEGSARNIILSSSDGITWQKVDLPDQVIL